MAKHYREDLTPAREAVLPALGGGGLSSLRRGEYKTFVPWCKV